MAIADQVVGFFEDLFGRIFSDAFRPHIRDVLRRKAVIRQVDEVADAASQSLTRFFRNQEITEQQAADILAGFAPLSHTLTLDHISNPNVTPESVVNDLLQQSLSIPNVITQQDHESVYRVALHSIVQVLMLVGPVMREWQKLGFASTFELLRRIVNRLNEINDQLDTLSVSGESAADERFELTYRDYLLQRFHRVEAGTVRMTTNLDVDLRELFVMPRVLSRPTVKEALGERVAEELSLMNLDAARKYFGARGDLDERRKQTDGEPKTQEGITALDQVIAAPRNVIVGLPGGGKSTFLEWLQLKVASVEQELVLAGKQAIPLLLRVRQLDPHNLPTGALMIEKATASRDRAKLMPAGWIERHMKAGRILLMLDGLDETEPELRDVYVLPWLQNLCRLFPKCGYLVSSRPVGYPVGTLGKLGFVECDLLDFNDEEIGEYTRHWCTAIRLARNEPEEEARREGEQEGEQILQSFKGHPYISNLARTPLMLSAICLVNYFEGGQLPRDRAVLYRLCVEGLLHHWDQRRGIHSEFTLDEKLRVCREVALAMQADDRAEYEADKILELFTEVFEDKEQAVKLLEHVRYRSGLLLERRPGVFAFAHLTFQEYLAARAVHEGNRLRLDPERLVNEHADARWKEVIALYCGLAPASAAIAIIKGLVNQPNGEVLASVLAEAYLSSGAEVQKDSELREQVLDRLAHAPGSFHKSELSRFPEDEIAPIANRFIGCTGVVDGIGETYWWLYLNSEWIQEHCLLERIKLWRDLNPFDVGDLNELLHRYGSNDVLQELSIEVEMYESAGPTYTGGGQYSTAYDTQADIAALGLMRRKIGEPGVDATFIQCLRVILRSSLVQNHSLRNIGMILSRNETRLPHDSSTWPEVASMLTDLATRTQGDVEIYDESGRKQMSAVLGSWIRRLKREIKASEKGGRASRTKSTRHRNSATKKLPPRRKS